MAEPKNIYCPQCGSKVAKWDGKAKIDIVANCRYCHKRVIYRIATDTTEIKRIPQRGESSGMTFY